MTYCTGCGSEIDPTTCGCGDSIDARGEQHDGHAAVPMGCDCLLIDHVADPFAVIAALHHELAKSRRGADRLRAALIEVRQVLERVGIASKV